MAKGGDDCADPILLGFLAILLIGYFVFIYPFQVAYDQSGWLGVLLLLALYISVGILIWRIIDTTWQKRKKQRQIQEYEKELMHRVEEEKRLRSLSDRSHLYSLTPRQFEHAVAEILVAHGYETEVTPYSGDFGTDIITHKSGRRYVVQVKQFSSRNKVGTRDMQVLQGSMLHYKANAMMFVTLGFFTAAATQYAKVNGIELVDGNELIEMAKKVSFPRQEPLKWEGLEVSYGEVDRWKPPWKY